jgi:TonB-linked SusC/RagA family outer membrane protein
MKKNLSCWLAICLTLLSLMSVTSEVFAQNEIRVQGTVTNNKGEPLKGVTLIIQKLHGGAVTDINGKFVIDKVDPGAVLEVSFLGMDTKIVEINNQTNLNIILEEKMDELEDVTVVAFSTQKKESVIGAITTVKPSELRVPASNLTTALAGRVAGMISYQQSGEPGQDNANFFIRGITSFGAESKKDPLILIDNVELGTADLARLNVDDIASFSIMKDATATALYGARGANGVILVMTKEGSEGKAKMNFRIENSWSSPTKSIELADPITYMRLGNEAVATRDPLSELPYSVERITMTERGLYPDLYPQTDWQSMLLDPVTQNQRVNTSVSGGGKVARYFVAGSLTRDNGNLKVDQRNNFNSNIKLDKYTLRSNVNINLTKTTEAILRMSGSFDDYTGPLFGGADVYHKVLQTNPVYFKPFYEPDANHATTRHILFGNYGKGEYLNPYAELLKGYKDYSKTMMAAQIELKQDLNSVVDGLSARLLFNTNRYSEFDVVRQYNPFFYSIPEKDFDRITEDYKLLRLNPQDGSEWIDYRSDYRYITKTTYLETALNYNKQISEKNNISGLLVYTMREYLATNNDNDLQKSLPSRNMGLSGRFTYNYDSRYFVETNFGYNGSERFSSKHRFGFFPSFGLAWMVSNENFFEGAKNMISTLKLRGTYGLVGNEQIGSSDDRFYYLSRVRMNDGGRAARFGKDLGYVTNGVTTLRYANPNIGWEIAYKSNAAVELSFNNGLTMIADFFKEKRKNILLSRVMPGAMGIESEVRANLGEAQSKGFDMELNYQHYINSDWWITGRGTFTFARSLVNKWEEPDYSSTPWRSRVGKPIGQVWGYVAERLFVDEYEVKNSPVQFGEYMAGDIKYRDINNDGKISDFDLVPIGHPTSPEINYGFGISTGYKKWDFSIFFQGSARQSFWVDLNGVSPFVNISSGATGNNALLSRIADSYWSEDNRDVYAFWPRLSNTFVDNNMRTSTWYMNDASFIRLKSAEIGYSLPSKLLRRLKMENLRVYANGMNLAVFSPFKMWDPEMAGNGLGYPVQRVINMGVNVNF